MDSDEIAQLFKREGDGELRPIPHDIYEQLRQHMEKSRNKAELAKGLSIEVYLDMLGNIREDGVNIDRFIGLRMRKIGEMAIHNAYHTDQMDTSNATHEEMEFYDRIYDTVKNKSLDEWNKGGI